MVSEQHLPDADVRLSGSVVEAFAKEEVTENTSVILVSRSTDIDADTIPRLLETRAAYIGVMGSRRRDEGIGSGGTVVRPDPVRRAGNPGGVLRGPRRAHPRSGGGDPEGRPLGRSRHVHSEETSGTSLLSRDAAAGETPVRTSMTGSTVRGGVPGFVSWIALSFVTLLPVSRRAGARPAIGIVYTHCGLNNRCRRKEGGFIPTRKSRFARSLVGQRFGDALRIPVEDCVPGVCGQCLSGTSLRLRLPLSLPTPPSSAA